MPDGTVEEKSSVSPRDQRRERIAEQARSNLSIKQSAAATIGPVLSAGSVDAEETATHDIIEVRAGSSATLSPFIRISRPSRISVFMEHFLETAFG